MMKVTKTSTNREAYNIYRRYENSTIDNVMSAYKTGCSNLKREAENDIKREMLENDGYKYRIISANGWNFSCGYKMLTFINDGIEILVYHTKSGVKYIWNDAPYMG